MEHPRNGKKISDINCGSINSSVRLTKGSSSRRTRTINVPSSKCGSRSVDGDYDAVSLDLDRREEGCKSLPAFGSDGSDSGYGPSSEARSLSADYLVQPLTRSEDAGSKYRLLDDGKGTYTKIPRGERGITPRPLSRSVSDVWEHVKGKRKYESSLNELTEEQRMRYKLKYHFMTPFQKYKRGRRPWKLCIQILKIIIVTIQVQIFEVIF